MRLIGVALVWIVIVGGLALYLVGRGEGPRAAAVSAPAVDAATFAEQAAAYSLELTVLGELAPDPFALPGAPLADHALAVSTNGAVAAAFTTAETTPGEPLVLSPPPGLRPGVTEYLVEAGTASGGFGQSPRAAVRVRLLHHGVPIVETTLWPEAGGIIRDVFRVTVAEHDHE